MIRVTGLLLTNMAKNRRTIITELFTAFAENEEIEYDEEQMWAFFESCVQKKLLKKLSKERESKTSTDGSSGTKTRGKTGYQHFLSEFKEAIPEGTSKREFKSAAWKELSSEEKEEWNEKAADINAANGFHKKSSSTDVPLEKVEEWKARWTQWNSADPATRGDEPLGPGSKNSSRNSSPEASPKASQKDTHQHTTTEDDSDSDSDSDDEEIARKLKAMQVSCQSDDDSSDDESSDDEDDSPDDKRLEWLKTAPPSDKGWKSNVSANFKAWIMFTNTDTFGPDKDNSISSTQFTEFKSQHDYGRLSKCPTAPWADFLTKNAIIV